MLLPNRESEILLPTFQKGEILERLGTVLRGASESDADCGWKAHLVDHIVSVRRVMRMQTNLCGNSC